jgi:coenzyme Q-binding protein COQ10
MPSIKNSRLMPYKIELLYSVIIDVEKYEKFIPWCKNITIISKKKQEIISDVQVEFLFIKECYRSIAKFTPPKKRNGEINAKANIEMIHGPLSHMSTTWHLKALGEEKTFVDFECDFAFKNKIYNKVASTVIMTANKKIMDSFIKRAAFLSETS